MHQGLQTFFTPKIATCLRTFSVINKLLSNMKIQLYAFSCLTNKELAKVKPVFRVIYKREKNIFQLEIFSFF